MQLFKFDDLQKKQPTETISQTDRKHDLLRKRFLSKHYHSINNIKELCGTPRPGEFFFIWSLKSFNAFSFIQYLVIEYKQVQELVITSYNIGKKVILALMHLVDVGAVQMLFIFICDVSKTRFPDVYELINLEAAKRSKNVIVAYRWNHSKVALVKANDNYFVIEGSGNFSDNARHEQYIFCNDQELYNYRKNWILNEINS